MTAALETQGLGRRYGSQWALQGCTLEIPRGTVTVSLPLGPWTSTAPSLIWIFTPDGT